MMDKKTTHQSFHQPFYTYILKVIIVFAVYFVSARFGLGISPVSGFATLVWPPTGIALAALFIFDCNLWPGVFLAAFLVNLITGAPILGAIGIATGNTLEAVVGALLLRRFGFKSSIERLNDVLMLIGIAAILSTAISATIGVISLFFSGVVSSTTYVATWTAWWVGDLLGDLIVAPFLFIWITEPWRAMAPKRVWEFIAILASLVLANVVIFNNTNRAYGQSVLIYLVFPPLIWLAIRFGQRAVTAIILATSAFAIWCTVLGYGPFTNGSTSQTLLQLQLFMGVLSVTIMILAASTHEKNTANQELTKFKLAVEGASDRIMITDSNGVILYANPASEKITGFSQEEILGKKSGSKELWGGLMDQAFYEKLWDTVKNHKKIFTSEIKNKRKSGKEYYGSLSISPILNTRGDVQFFVEIERDVTQEKELDKAKTEFISIASHQLRTPVQTLTSLIELLRPEFAGLSKEGQTNLNNLSTSVGWLSKLAEDLLNVSRIESGSIKPEVSVINLADFIKSFLHDMESYASVKNHQLNFKNLLKGSASIEADPKLLYNVLQNLVANAIDYSPTGIPVMITLEHENTNIKFSVAHGGPSIPKEDQGKLFKKFSRGNEGRTMRPEGTGLGLYIIKSSVEIMNGQVGFRSEEGEDTLFWFTIPVGY